MSMLSDRFFLTTPLYYVNAEPHIGSAYTNMVCDALARYQRMTGNEVCLLTGVDEHGGKIETTAEKAGIDPLSYCDQITAKFKALWELYKIKYDLFSRTTDPHHSEVVQAFFRRVLAKGDIYKAKYKGLYCLACEDFKTERDLLDGKLCSIHQIPVQEYGESNYFFALSRYTDSIRAHIKSNPGFILPRFREGEVLAWLEEARDFPISRRSVKWGIPVPGDEEQTIYVWFDALLGYLSPFIEGADLEGVLAINPRIQAWRPSAHIIGKDILRFHAVYWIGMLMSAGLPLPKHVFGHGFLTKDGEKMGKTRGNIIDPIDLVERFGLDAVRFYFLFAIPFGNDGDFSEKVFIDTCNAYLANRLGNLVSRVLKLCETYSGGLVATEYTSDPESETAQRTLEGLRLYREAFEAFDPQSALTKIFEVVDFLNLRFTSKKPWETLKNPESRLEGIKILFETLESLYFIAHQIMPFTPGLATRMLAVYALDQPLPLDQLSWNSLRPGQNLVNPGALFSRI
ncbi:MAG: methionine--tRNA ligase [Candidatus Caenarcaniphilales bacterium]|nr:methionine--tRNA ligase [Candidatus Caenarcaniphilales bacterium]